MRADLCLYETAEAGGGQRFGVPPDRYVQFAALRGDGSDNLAGVPGVGAKTAARLLTEFDSIDDVYARIAEVPGKKVPAMLLEHRDIVDRNLALMTLRRDVAVGVGTADLVRREIRIFRALNGFYKPGFEGTAFPELFPFGQGFFDAERKRPFRFKEYRQRIIVQCEGQFFRSDKWFNWSAMIEELIEQALINELATERDRARHPQACVDKQPRVNRLARLNRRIGASLLSR